MKRRANRRRIFFHCREARGKSQEARDDCPGSRVKRCSYEGESQESRDVFSLEFNRVKCILLNYTVISKDLDELKNQESIFLL